MENIAAVNATRHALGPVGVMLPVSFTAPPPIDLQRAAVSRLARHLHRQHLGAGTTDRARGGGTAGPGVPRQVRARPRGRLPGAGGQYREGMGQPAGQRPRFTAQARQVLGPDKLLVVAIPVVIDATSATVREHLAAGADHVILMVPPGGDFTAGVNQLAELAPALADITRE